MKKIFAGFIIVVGFVTTIGILSFIYYNNNRSVTNQPINNQSQPKDALEPEEREDAEIEEIDPTGDELIDENKDVNSSSDSEQEQDKDSEEEETVEKEDSEEIQDIEESGEHQNESTLNNDEKSWSWARNEEHQPPKAYADYELLEKYDAYYLGDTDEKVMYLTFDNGYENGYTNDILDTLKDNDVKAAFFVTKAYIRDNIDIVKRMKEEGHIVGNHTVTHPSMPSITDEQIYNEIMETEAYMLEETGYDMDKFLRPPSGKYSERSLYLTKELGYKSIFWSIAYGDWDVNNQPGALYAFDHVMTNHHPGAIPLLHAVSSSNEEALEDIIQALKEEGYRFASLDELD